VISVENSKLFGPLYLAPPLKQFSLELATGGPNKKTRMMGLPGREKIVTISSAVWIQYAAYRNVTQTDGQTDRQIPGDSKDRAYASRGKNLSKSAKFGIRFMYT